MHVASKLSSRPNLGSLLKHYVYGDTSMHDINNCVGLCKRFGKHIYSIADNVK